MVKPHLVKNLCAAVEITTVIVQRLCTVAEGFQRAGSTLHLVKLRVSLIRIFSRSEETHAHAGKDFKLCVGCFRLPTEGTLKYPAGIFVKQFP